MDDSDVPLSLAHELFHILAWDAMPPEYSEEASAGLPRLADDRGPARPLAHGPSPSTYSTILPGMSTPVVSMLFLNSIV